MRMWTRALGILGLAALSGFVGVWAQAAGGPSALTPGERDIEEYFAPLRAKCEQGDAAACRMIAGRMPVSTGLNEVAGHTRALKKACEQKNWTACTSNAMAALAAADPGMTQDGAAAIFQQGCTARDDFSCALLAELWYRGPNRQQGEDLARKSCDDLGGWPCVMAGQLLMQTGDVAGGAARMQRACDSGDAFACYQLGMLYAEGSGSLKKSEAKATDLYSKACDDNLGQACYNLAWQYLRGTGAAKNKKRADELLERACLLGDPSGCDYIGTLAVERGADGTVWEKLCQRWGAAACYNHAVNLTEGGETAEIAERLIAVAQAGCLRGNQGSCNALGHLARDFIRACENKSGVRDACAFAGYLYLSGVRLPHGSGASIEPDLTKAGDAFKASCEAGAQVSCERMKAIGGPQPG